MIGVQPLWEGKRSGPAFLPPSYFKDPMGACKVEGIPITGQDIDWGSTSPCWETTSGPR